MKIRWAPKASTQLEAIYDYLAGKNRQAAEMLVDRIYSAIDVLELYPEIGRLGRIEDTRELIVTNTPYIVFYRIRHENIHILAIIHGARKLPRRF
ncbi:MAG TPA: type II toxin-antitoxin system RelE/ParE family toxin [Nitrososphaera sp.]|nr:type II toxin-antitoxin system RelE/ParE family toxin [Nitrososphaera sp.]